MKQFNLDEYLKNPSRKVITRDGRNVTIHCTNFAGERPIIAEIEGLNTSIAFTNDGRFDYIGDLFFAPEKHEGWVNIYRHSVNSNDPYCFDVIYASEEEARHYGSSACATVKIEWEE